MHHLSPESCSPGEARRGGFLPAKLVFFPSAPAPVPFPIVYTVRSFYKDRKELSVIGEASGFFFSFGFHSGKLESGREGRNGPGAARQDNVPLLWKIQNDPPPPPPPSLAVLKGGGSPATAPAADNSDNVSVSCPPSRLPLSCPFV